jgi:hypothetical protein
MEPFEIRYRLTRAQRLIPLLRAWGVFGPLLILGFVAFAILAIVSVWWFVFIALGMFCMVKGLVFGLIGIAADPAGEMDIRVEENGLGFMGKKERWWIFLDGVTNVYQPRSDIWTVCHHNGTLITIPADKITAERVEHIRSGPRRMKEKREAQPAAPPYSEPAARPPQE